MKKTNEELVSEFIEKGGSIEVIPTVEEVTKNQVGNTTKKSVTLFSLEEAESLFGEKPVRQSKKSKVDVSNINMDLIPDHLKRLILSKCDNDITKEK
jgi:hypothetical protein